MTLRRSRFEIWICQSTVEDTPPQFTKKLKLRSFECSNDLEALLGASNRPRRKFLPEAAPIEALSSRSPRHAAVKQMLPMQPGGVPATYADIEDLAREIGFRPATTIEQRVARFAKWYRERNEQTYHSTDHVRRRRNAAMAGLARGPSTFAFSVCNSGLE
jgi:hypothetical protein